MGLLARLSTLHAEDTWAALSMALPLSAVATLVGPPERQRGRGTEPGVRGSLDARMTFCAAACTVRRPLYSAVTEPMLYAEYPRHTRLPLRVFRGRRTRPRRGHGLTLRWRS